MNEVQGKWVQKKNRNLNVSQSKFVLSVLKTSGSRINVSNDLDLFDLNKFN